MYIAMTIGGWLAMLTILVIHGLQIKKIKKSVESQAYKEAAKTTRKILGMILSGEDKNWRSVCTGLGHGYSYTPSEVQEKFKTFVIGCITEGVEGSPLIMGMIDEKYQELTKAVNYWATDEFVEHLVERLNKYQLQ